MNIITPGSLPPPPVYTGTCTRCGCVVEEVKPLLTSLTIPIFGKRPPWWAFFSYYLPVSYTEIHHLVCPTEFCRRKIRMNPVDQT